MRLHEILTEEQLDELNRRDFLKQGTLAVMGAGLTAAGLDQGSHAAEVEKDKEEDEDEEVEEARYAGEAKITHGEIEWSSRGGFLYLGDCRSDEAMAEMGYDDATEFAYAVENAEPISIEEFKKLIWPNDISRKLLRIKNRDNIALERDAMSGNVWIHDFENDIHHFWG